MSEPTETPTVDIASAHREPGDSAPIASVENLVKTYQKPGSSVFVHALRGVSINFVAGESVAICGASGSGKSTMLNLLGCLDRPTSGIYRLGGLDVSTLDDDALSEIRGERIGFVFQNFNLIHQLTVLENLEVPLFYQGVPQQERKKRAEELIARVGLADRGDHRPMELSGGQQQRAAIARSLINNPVIILADEPTGNLDTETGEMILEVFDELRTEGRTVLMVTHEAEVANRCDRIITMRDGKIIEDRMSANT
ncbi:MAG: ABC transporter ATP-binding protein [Planctomycetes bacterium]|nr:ABC transporter ATP-binding protein [Planctomycetota bacterium]